MATRIHELMQYHAVAYDIPEKIFYDNMKESNTICNIANKRPPKIVLNDNFKKIDDVDIKINLYPHQKIVIQAMLDIENNNSYSNRIDDNIIKVEFNAAVLSEKVGSGKTFEILGLIIKSKVPRNRIIYQNIYDPEDIHNVQLKKKFHKIIPVNLIFVGAGTLKQWKSAINDYTKLSVFVVSDIASLEKFITKIISGTIHDYDIILIKNGKVTRMPEVIDTDFDFTFIPNPYVKSAYLTIWNIIASMQNICWARVIIDDFDVVNMSEYSSHINACFNWFVSSTLKIFKNVMYTKYTNIDDYLINPIPTIGLANTKRFFNLVNIRCDDGIIEKSQTFPKINYYTYQFTNPHPRFHNIVRELVNNDNLHGEIREMANADAFDAIANRLNIKAKSPNELIMRLIGNKVNEFEKVTETIQFIEKSIKFIKSDKYNDLPISTKVYTISSIHKETPIEFKHPNLLELFEKELNECRLKIKDDFTKLERIKDHLLDGECPVCFLNITEDHNGEAVICKTCNVIMCKECTLSILKSLNKSCPNCRSLISADNLIYISNDINLDTVIKNINKLNSLNNSSSNDNVAEDNVAEDNVAEDNVAEDNDEKNINHQEFIMRGDRGRILHNRLLYDGYIYLPVNDPLRTNHNYSKYDTAIDIINGVNINIKREVRMNINQIIIGSNDNPTPPDAIKKILIFSNYEDTLRKITIRLRKEQIPYIKLDGTYSKISQKINDFKDNPHVNVMLISAAKYCAGLNLQFATDLIFMHHMINDDTQIQVIGRIMRLGRKYNPRIHYLLYEEEYNELVAREMIRPL